MKQYLREPTICEIAGEIGIPKEAIVFAMDAIENRVSLDDPGLYRRRRHTLCDGSDQR